MMHRFSFRAAVVGAMVLAGAGVHAQDTDVETLSDLDEGVYPDMLDGTLSPAGDLVDDAAPNSGRFRFDTALGPWNEAKARFRETTGITFGGSYQILWQNFSDPGLGDRDAIGQKLTLNFSRPLTGAGAANPLILDVAIEGRGPVGTDNPPLTAGILAGSLTPTAATYGEFDLGITQFYIRQSLADNKFQYTIGKIFAPNFINAYPFFDDNRQFLNQAFSTSPTIPTPLRGFGAVALWYPTTTGAYVQAGVFTANSDDTGITVDNFFEDGELFYSLELGWSGLSRTPVPIQARGPMDTNNVHLSFWYKDAQPNAAAIFQPEAKGVAFNANFMAGENVMWFARGGISDGWVTERNLTAGFGYRPSGQFSDLFGFGVGWVDPANDALREQIVAEAFYRYHVTPNFAITPDLQIIQDPSLNPAVDTLYVAGLRARITF
jgi:hypothetical protein